MKPDDTNQTPPARQNPPYVPASRAYLHPSERTPNESQRQVAVELIRGQLDTFYETGSTANTATREPIPTSTPAQPLEHVDPQPVRPEAKQATATADEFDTNPYDRTQQNPATISEDQWKQYHSSWQEYYQQYYHRYYLHAVAANQAKPDSNDASVDASIPEENNGMTQREAMRDLRSQLRTNISTSASKIRKSRHFVPILAAIGVFLVFMFLQYNRVMFAAVEAYVAPGSVSPEDIIVNPSSTEVVGDESKLIIPKINVSVPAIFDGTMGSTNAKTHDLQMKAMEKGVAWFGIPGANSKPGQAGNTVLSGHSSNDVIDPGEYKFIFARLDKLKEGDTIYVTNKGVRYTYNVSSTKVVKPSELSALRVGNDKPVLTLITCTPLGTSTNRLLVFADQISPNPDEAKAADESMATEEDVEMPGNSPTFLQRIFGGDT